MKNDFDDRIEDIRHAAVLAKDGTVIMGKCHGDCFHKGDIVGLEMSNRADAQGFFTNKGRYVGREEAAKIAKNAHQLKDNRITVLISEDIWSSRDGKFDYHEMHGYIPRGMSSLGCVGCDAKLKLKETKTCDE